MANRQRKILYLCLFLGVVMSVLGSGNSLTEEVDLLGVSGNYFPFVRSIVTTSFLAVFAYMPIIFVTAIIFDTLYDRLYREENNHLIADKGLALARLFNPPVKNNQTQPSLITTTDVLATLESNALSQREVYETQLTGNKYPIDDIPKEFISPISLNIMVNPIIAVTNVPENSQTYERYEILDFLHNLTKAQNYKFLQSN